MHYPDSLATLVAQGIITEVLRPLRSGKEAQIYLVMAAGEERVAKIYKEAQNRSFKHRSDYTEGRQTRSSRDARAMNKHTKYGRSKDEEAWKSAEVEAIYKLSAAGVRVPQPYNFIDGVLIMELVKDLEGEPAPRLGEAELNAAEARAIFDQLLAEVVRMLDAGLVHGDLSDFNVLLGAKGPVVIDFPQSVDAARNQNARELLIRDVDNLTRFLSRFEPAMKGRPYGQELWQIYERGELRADTPLTGVYKAPGRTVDTAALLEDIGEIEREEMKRRAGLARSGGGRGRGGARSGPGAGGGAPRPPSSGARPTPQQASSAQHASHGPRRAAEGGERRGGGPRAAEGHGGDRRGSHSGGPRAAEGHGGERRGSHSGGPRAAEGHGGERRGSHSGGPRTAPQAGGQRPPERQRPAPHPGGGHRPDEHQRSRPAPHTSGAHRPPHAEPLPGRRPEAASAAAAARPEEGRRRRRRRRGGGSGAPTENAQRPGAQRDPRPERPGPPPRRS